MNGTRRSLVGATGPWRDVTVDGVRLAVDDEGAGMPTLVCLHAIGHGASDFAALRRAFAPTRRVVALDWPGQGNSADDTRPPSAARYARLLDGVLDALGIERAVLVGNSIGGATALRYAATHPERVAGLVLENPGGLDRPDRLSRRVIDLMVRFFAAGSRRAAWFPRAFAAYYRTVLQRAAAATQRARIVATAYEIAPVLHDAWLSFGTPEADLRDLVPTIRCPTLFAWGVHDVAVQLRRSLSTIAQFPNARLERFAAGHAAHLETPDELVAAVRRFLAAQKL